MDQPDLNDSGGSPLARAAVSATLADFNGDGSPSPSAVASGDITGSPRVDLVELEDTTPQQVTVYENNTLKR